MVEGNILEEPWGKSTEWSGYAEHGEVIMIRQPMAKVQYPTIAGYGMYVYIYIYYIYKRYIYIYLSIYLSYIYIYNYIV